eukprot:symbB.v1.2.005547.t1/scaffold258.1/size251559/1
MFQRRELSRGSGLWVDECNEGGHARNRKALEGQKRDDACGFWDVQGASPAPPAPVLRLFQRLETAAERFRSAYGWPLLCSRLGMAAVYDGKGACYEQHRDNEWQRHLTSRTPKGLRPKTGSEAKQRRLDFGDGPSGAWMNFRELTMLAYVNLPEDFGDHPKGQENGGRLRCYVSTKRGDLCGETARELKDLEPVGGRAVIFRSKELLHEVEPKLLGGAKERFTAMASSYSLVLELRAAEETVKQSMPLVALATRLVLFCDVMSALLVIQLGQFSHPALSVFPILIAAIVALERRDWTDPARTETQAFDVRGILGAVLTPKNFSSFGLVRRQKGATKTVVLMILTRLVCGILLVVILQGRDCHIDHDRYQCNMNPNLCDRTPGNQSVMYLCDCNTKKGWQTQGQYDWRCRSVVDLRRWNKDDIHPFTGRVGHYGDLLRGAESHQSRRHHTQDVGAEL